MRILKKTGVLSEFEVQMINLMSTMTPFDIVTIEYVYRWCGSAQMTEMILCDSRLLGIEPFLMIQIISRYGQD